MVSSVKEMGTGIEITMCCEKPMNMSGFSYEQGEGGRNRYVCQVCGSGKWIKIGVAKK